MAGEAEEPDDEATLEEEEVSQSAYFGSTCTTAQKDAMLRLETCAPQSRGLYNAGDKQCPGPDRLPSPLAVHSEPLQHCLPYKHGKRAPQELAREEDDDTANEIQDLADEADLPIEQLMARYGYVANDGADTADDGKEGQEEPLLPASTEAAAAASPADAQGSQLATESPAAEGLQPSGAEQQEAGPAEEAHALEGLQEEAPDTAGRSHCCL